MVLLPILETKLPGELREKWELELASSYENYDNKVDIELFFRFLDGHVLSKEARSDFVDVKPPVKLKFKSVGYRSKLSRLEGENMSSASALLNTVDCEKKCGFCAREHDTVSCKLALSKSPEERWCMLKKNTSVQTCYNCLQPGNVSHNSRTCKKPKCSIDVCGKRHHILLHTDSASTNNGQTVNMINASEFTSYGLCSTHL